MANWTGSPKQRKLSSRASVDIPGIYASSTLKRNLFGKFGADNAHGQVQPTSARFCRRITSGDGLPPLEKRPPASDAPSFQPIPCLRPPVFLVKHAGCQTQIENEGSNMNDTT
jgi:hypothetical protein